MKIEFDVSFFGFQIQIFSHSYSIGRTSALGAISPSTFTHFIRPVSGYLPKEMGHMMKSQQPSLHAPVSSIKKSEEKHSFINEFGGTSLSLSSYAVSLFSITVVYRPYRLFILYTKQFLQPGLTFLHPAKSMI